MTTPLPRLNKYGLAAPCADDVRSAVAAVDYLNFTKNWNSICENAGIGRHANLLDIDRMHALSNALIEEGGSFALIGKGFAIRVASYQQFAKVDDDENRSIDLGRRTFEGLLRSRVPEPAVLAEVSTLDLASPNNRMRLDDASRRVASALRCSMGYVGVMLSSAQYMAGQHGLEGFGDLDGAPIEWAFCATTIRRRETYIVPDAEADVVQRSNPLVKFHGVKSYAGVPMINEAGVVIGTLCVMDSKAREFTPEEIEKLEETAKTILAELEESRDTRIRNRARV